VVEVESQRKRVTACPDCGGPLLFVEGVAHRARSVELDDGGQIHGVEFAEPKPVSYHHLTWIECDKNCGWDSSPAGFFTEG
jgi:hypothetical protein